MLGYKYNVKMEVLQTTHQIKHATAVCESNGIPNQKSLHNSLQLYMVTMEQLKTQLHKKPMKIF